MNRDFEPGVIPPEARDAIRSQREADQARLAAIQQQQGPRYAIACWEVVAGLLPGQPIDEYTRQFWFTDQDAHARFEQLHAEATEYARSLVNPSRLNWVRVDWIWF